MASLNLKLVIEREPFTFFVTWGLYESEDFRDAEDAMRFYWSKKNCGGGNVRMFASFYWSPDKEPQVIEMVSD